MDVARAARQLERWFSSHARPLPWRGRPNPYHVLVTEFVLQQTRIATGIPYYERIIARFPSIHDLARARASTLLALWSGLGYYRRAHNLHATARLIVRRHQGRVPRDVRTLLELPGIGPYTAGAIASIAYDEPEPSLDGNQLRVFSRLTGMRGALTKARHARIESQARSLLLHGSPRRLNQALMDVGSTLCLPKNPLCGSCPLRAGCRGRTRGLPEARRRRPASRAESWNILLHVKNSRLWLRTPRTQGLLAGLWLPPIRRGRAIGGASEAVHVFSHRRWRIQWRHVRAAPAGRGRWVSRTQLRGIPHSRLTLKAFDAAGL